MVQILVVLILLGLLLYIVNLLPLDATIKKIIQAVAIVLVVIWLIGWFVPLGNYPMFWPPHR